MLRLLARPRNPPAPAPSPPRDAGSLALTPAPTAVAPRLPSLACPARFLSAAATTAAERVEEKGEGEMTGPPAE